MEDGLRTSWLYQFRRQWCKANMMELQQGKLFRCTLISGRGTVSMCGQCSTHLLPHGNILEQLALTHAHEAHEFSKDGCYLVPKRHT